MSLDVAATAAAVAGLPADAQLDGVNLIPYLRGEAQGVPHDTLYWRWIAQSAVREGHWKYLRGGAREYLFDIETDREERHNLLAKHPVVVERLRTKLASRAQHQNPPGLETKHMAAMWEQYFDHYLDGKPAPAPGTTAGLPGTAGERPVRGWIARNSTAAVKDGILHVTPNRATGPRPFIACARLHIPGPAIATLELQSAVGGEVGFAWRTQGQRDFPPDQTRSLPITASDRWQDIEAELPAPGQIIHLRVLLPRGESLIRRIHITGAEGDVAKTWHFAGKLPQP
jgi:uncharacterized sulfatase